MKTFFAYLFVIALFIPRVFSRPVPITPPGKTNFDAGWKFHLGNVSNAHNQTFNDGSWRNINLPHDWSIEGHYGTQYRTDWQSGYLPAGIGWYRKTFNYQPAWHGQQIQIMFDGVYMNSDVWINGKHLGHRPNGYLGFVYNLTPYLKKGHNVITVKVDHSKPQSARWYTGSGIYRHVWLLTHHTVFIPQWGTCVTTPNVSASQATVAIKTHIENNSAAHANIELLNIITDKNGKIVARQQSARLVNKNSGNDVTQNLVVNNPHLWSDEEPYLYTVTSIVRRGNTELNRQQNHIGIRSIRFSADSGFILNNKKVKLKGVCLHQDAGPVGVAVPDQVLLRRLKLLKQMGCNAIRTSHNPFSPVFYDLCDSMGIMVMDEALDGWEHPKANDDYGNYFTEWWKRDITDFVMRDRNHPSVIIWSIGNEVSKPTRETQKALVDLIHSLDPTRPVTQGGQDPTRGMKGNGERTLLDIYGFNGDGEEKEAFEKYHEKFAQVPIVGTEVPHTYQTRGVYRTETQWRRRDFPAPWEIASGTAGSFKGLENKITPIKPLSEKEIFPEELQYNYYINGKTLPIENKAPWAPKMYYQSSYDNATIRISARRAWQRVEELPYLMGEFRWGSFDYLGESNGWPSRMANFGILDICGFPKDHFYLYQSLWTSKPMVHILPHWTHSGKEGTVIPVVIYTNCDEVELFLNDKSLGKQPYQKEQLVWQVPYAPGTLKAVAYKNGKIAITQTCSTAGKPATIKAQADKTSLKASSTSIAHIELTITDAKGTPVPLANNNITFKITGPGKLIGVDNGDPLDLSDYKANQRLAFRSKCLAIVQATGKPGTIYVTCSSPALTSGRLAIVVK